MSIIAQVEGSGTTLATPLSRKRLLETVQTGLEAGLSHSPEIGTPVWPGGYAYV
jgi:hypothetical protein